MKKYGLTVLLALGLTACATGKNMSDDAADDSALETYNRAVFEFNYQLDKAVIKPVAKGYKKVTNQFARDRVSTFFNNLEEPAYALNNLFQGKVKDSGVSVGRFAVNSTLGLLGLFDVADGWGLSKKKNSFDATMAYYCMPDGPFFMVPVLGPATPRYLVGWAGDAYASPMYWALVDVDDSGVDAAVWGSVALKYINIRAESLALTDSLEAGAVDFYATMKSAFMQNRQKFTAICDAKNNQDNVPSYDFDFGYDDVDDDFE